MKKQLLNLGKGLSKAEQKLINGGKELQCESDMDCDPGMYCGNDACRAICNGEYCTDAVSCDFNDECWAYFE